MNLINRLLSKNISASRIAGFVISNFIGLAIVVGALFFYEDAGQLWRSDDSFIKNDFIVINKKVTTSDLWGEKSSGFSENEIEDIRRQPWVRNLGNFRANDYRVWASVEGGGRGMSTMLFFESVPDEFVDALSSDWFFNEEKKEVPVIISKEYLTLYNFGFAGSAGLPKMSESLMSGIPMKLTLSSEDGSRVRRLDARIVGFSNRLNTILVPETFMQWSNNTLGEGEEKEPQRLIIDVNSPGDVAIKEYLEDKGYELAGDKTASSASYLLKVVTGLIVAIGGLITILSFFILLLSMSLLMEKNKEKLHSLLMLGFRLKSVASPYVLIVVMANLLAFALAAGCGLLLRGSYLHALSGLGLESGSVWVGLTAGGILTLIIITFNILAIRRRVIKSW